MTRMGNLALQRAAFLKAKKLIDHWARWAITEARRIEADSKKRATFEAKRDERAQRDAWCRENGEPDPCAGWSEQVGRVPARRACAEPSPSPRPIATPASRPSPPRWRARCSCTSTVTAPTTCSTMMALSDEVGFRIRSFHHALEAYKIRDQLASRADRRLHLGRLVGLQDGGLRRHPRERRARARGGRPRRHPLRLEPRASSA
jgi:hypothetical protein